MAPKRAADGASAVATKRAKAVPAKPKDPVEKMCDAIASALETAPDLTETCREMLVSMLPMSTGVPKDKRHAHQETVANMVEDVLRGIEGRLAEQVSEQQKAKDEVDAEKADLEKARDELDASHTAKLQEEEERRAVESERRSARAEAEALLAAARKAQAEATKAIESAADHKSKCVTVATDHFEKIMEGTWETPSEMKAHVKALVSLGVEFKFDESLLSGMPAAAAKKPSERGSFDGMLMAQYQEQLQGRISSFDKLLQDGEAVAAEHAAKVQTAETLLEATRAGEKEATEAVVAVEAEAKELLEKVRAAKKAVRDFAPQLRKAGTACGAAGRELARFRSACLSDPFAVPQEAAAEPVDGDAFGVAGA